MTAPVCSKHREVLNQKCSDCSKISAYWERLLASENLDMDRGTRGEDIRAMSIYSDKLVEQQVGSLSRGDVRAAEGSSVTQGEIAMAHPPRTAYKEENA